MINNWKRLIPQKLVNSFWHLPKAILANLFYGFPSKKLTVIGVTGTSGKTTTAHLIYHLLLKAKFKVALISTISAKIGEKEIDIGLHVTNPDPFTLQKLLKRIATKGFQFVVLEITSHGLDQHRPWGINFTYGVLTNITHEHLDYHKNFKNYQQAKLKLIKNSQIAVLNQADPSYKSAKKIAPGRIISYEASQALLLPASLPGDFNQENVTAAQVVAQDLCISDLDLKSALKSFPGIPGRMEIIQTKPFTIIIDFAHKPDALKKALISINKLKGKKGRLISVFGSAGLRDHAKRSIMGKIAAKHSDVTILTAEDPRTENVTDINDQIEAGFIKVKSHGKLVRQPDRQKAINLAIKMAKPDDYVCLFGKSHEKSMCFGTIEYPWDEFRAVNKALKQRRIK